RHASEEDLWIIIDSSVYDMSRFIDLHPGGAFPILELAGKLFFGKRKCRTNIQSHKISFLLYSSTLLPIPKTDMIMGVIIPRFGSIINPI
ncbi:hypothetical protein INT46_006831, partial [Mucor plumbeus]